MPKVAIVAGSSSDTPVMENASSILHDAGIEYEMVVISAHREPERLRQFIRRCEEEGVEVFIAGAGWAAHLAGFIASHTHLPVIGVPISSSPLSGMDALLSTLQMPPGVPVATVAVDCAKNGALMALRVLALKYPHLSAYLKGEDR